MSHRIQHESDLLQGGRVSRRHDTDPRTARRRILALGGLAALITGAIVLPGGDKGRTITVQPGQTTYGIAKQELMRDGNEDPDVAEINTEVDKIGDANPGKLSYGDTVVAGSRLNLP